MAKDKGGSKIVGSKRTMKQAPKIHHGNHNSSGMMSKNSPKRC